MMIRMSDKGIFELLDISARARDYEILRIVLQIVEETGMSPTFSVIEDRVNAENESPFSKQWIYKCLNNLEQMNFIIVDRVARPITYTADRVTLRQGLEQIVQGKIHALQEKKQRTTNALEAINETNIYDLAYYIVDILSGKRIERVTGVIEGQKNIRQSIILELCERTKVGDIIRINDRSNLVGMGFEESNSLEQKLMGEVSSKGLQLKMLLHRDRLQESFTAGGLDDFLEDNSEILIEILSNGNLEIRSPPDHTLPFRMIAVNNDKMFMFLADTPNPDTVAIIYREGNPLLIDQAVENFDRVWEESVSLTNDVMYVLRNNL